MIHRLFNLTRPLLVFDVESTGSNVEEDRIIQIGFQLFTAEGLQKEWRGLVNPEMAIPPASTKVHGITDRDVQGCRICKRYILRAFMDSPGEEYCVCEKPSTWPTFRQLAPNIAQGMTGCDFAGKNVRFDLRITAAEMLRAGEPWSYAGARIIDADRLEQLGEPRKLSDLYKKHTGLEMEDAHDALADVRATTTVIEKQIEKYEVLPRDLDALHALQWPGWIDGEGKFKFVDGVACVGNWGKHKGKPMHAVDRSYWDFILKGDFSAEIKAIASAAKLRQFPMESK